MSGQMDLMDLPAVAPPRRSNKHGHAAVPGSGPAGEKCGGCAHMVRLPYLKCGLMHAYWTRGEGTDIRAKDAACRRWKKEDTQ